MCSAETWQAIRTSDNDEMTEDALVHAKIVQIRLNPCAGKLMQKN